MKTFQGLKRSPLKRSTTYTLKRSPLASKGKKGKRNDRLDAKDRTLVHAASGRSCEYCGALATQVHHTRTKGAHCDLRHEVALQVDLCAECHAKADSLVWNLEMFRALRPAVFAAYNLGVVLEMARGRSK